MIGANNLKILYRVNFPNILHLSLAFLERVLSHPITVAKKKKVFKNEIRKFIF